MAIRPWLAVVYHGYGGKARVYRQRDISLKGDPREHVMVVKAYCDESGKLADHKFVVFAACVAGDSNWDVISQRWNEIILSRGISCVSMKDAMTFHGQFSGWAGREQERDDLIYGLLDMAMPLVGSIATAPMSTDEFKSLTPVQQKMLRNPQYCGFEACMRLILSDLRPGLDFHVVCDSSEEYSPTMLKLYIQLRARDEAFKRRCIAITFAEDYMFPPIQLADMVAYCERQRRMKAVDEQPAIVRRIMDRLEQTRQKTIYQGYAIDGPGLGHGILTKE